ncbi:hypothetical protein Aph02nite_80770 [Actinoplanes philippinensis]|uniref:Zeta toxin n=1 Tax=Actinoplanes philippinensis TaxID=35752 RepID=A0A1I2KXU5_9ACTN|nr:AAA family ATPase [Actinoplanes philippinensis]GIE82127.1 hypothetical protein Aph02nite_80770 [Actinoplanes philippinensis]SFF69726.1 Zeta toxin [Actinoplanes philippinensis]
MPETPTLVILRGNSGSGKTTTAREARRRYGRGCALIEQDHLRRVILREHGGLGDEALAPRFIVATTKAALDAGYHVILEGILHTGEYGLPLRNLVASHPGRTACFYMDIGFEETVRRHRTREDPIPVTPEMMQEWYTKTDLLGIPNEKIIPENASFEQAVRTIMKESGLSRTTPQTPCPTQCQRCGEKQS